MLLRAAHRGNLAELKRLAADFPDDIDSPCHRVCVVCLYTCYVCDVWYGGVPLVCSCSCVCVCAAVFVCVGTLYMSVPRMIIPIAQMIWCV